MGNSEMSLKIENLKVSFCNAESVTYILKGLSLQLEEAQIVALVGSSGSGKTLTGLSILRLLPPGAKIAEGQIIFQGTDLLKASPTKMQSIRGKEIGIVFQEPLSALNPLFTAGFQIGEVLKFHTDLNDKQIKSRTQDLLELVGIPHPPQTMADYPHQLSGGMRQRIMIAQAIAATPKVLIADEPTSNLDVILQAQIMELFSNLKKELHLSILLITHDLVMVAHLADRVAVMFDGKVVEFQDPGKILKSPEHFFTRQLSEAVRF